MCFTWSISFVQIILKFHSHTINLKDTYNSHTVNTKRWKNEETRRKKWKSFTHTNTHTFCKTKKGEIERGNNKRRLHTHTHTLPLTHENNRRLQIETKLCFRGPYANFVSPEFHFDKLNHMKWCGRKEEWKNGSHGHMHARTLYTYGWMVGCLFLLCVCIGKQIHQKEWIRQFDFVAKVCFMKQYTHTHTLTHEKQTIINIEMRINF